MSGLGLIRCPLCGMIFSTAYTPREDAAAVANDMAAHRCNGLPGPGEVKADCANSIITKPRN